MKKQIALILLTSMTISAIPVFAMDKKQIADHLRRENANAECDKDLKIHRTCFHKLLAEHGDKILFGVIWISAGIFLWKRK